MIFNNKIRFPFTNQFPSTPKSSKYSEVNGLLVKKYSIPKDTINIFDENYRVVDAWVSHNFTNSKKEKINKNYLKFLCTFENIRTKEKFIDQTKGNVLNLISHNTNSFSYGFNGVGKDFSHLTLFFDDKNIENLPDTIKIFVKNEKETKVLNFY